MRLFVLTALLAACTPKEEGEDTSGGSDTGGDTADTADTAEDVPGALEPGEGAEMTENEDGSVSIEVVNPGTYMVVLMSQAINAGEIYGYADNAAAQARRVGGERAPEPREEDVPVMSAAVGDTRTIEVDGDTVEAEAVYVGADIVVWMDRTTESAFEVEQETIDGIVSSFETIVLPRERQVFGEESDVDEDDKVHLVFSYAVNDYAVAYVTGCDIGSAMCTGNGGEFIYISMPDPESRYASVDGITETVAHELNHLIYGWHKYKLNDQVGASENIYLTEGMSALAQDLSGYNNGNQYVWAAAIDGRDIYGRSAREMTIDGVSINDFLRGASYYDDQRDGTLRGAAYLFLRYLFEQAGGFTVEEDGTLVDAGGMAFLHTWFGAPETGIDTVPATTGREVLDVAMDWYTAIVVTGRVETDNPAWVYQERVVDPLTGYEFGVDPFANIHGYFQLEGPLTQKVDTNDGEIRGGGVEYLEIELTEAGTVTVPVSPDARARGRIIRVE